MSDPGRVVVIAGGLSSERDVSLRSGRRVAEHLRSVGVDLAELDAGPDLVAQLRDDPPAAVFPVVHGRSGEDGALREVLALLGIPYVGSDPAACRLSWDKPVAKAVLAGAGVRSPAGVVIAQDAFSELGAGAVLDAVRVGMGLPVMVKPTRGGSAQGCRYVAGPDELPEAMVDCFGYGSTALFERVVVGTEVAVSVVDTGDGPRALPPVEIVPVGGRYDYAARYNAGATEFFVPARLTDRVAAACAEMALAAHRSLGLRDLSRSDLIVDDVGIPWFLEVATAPGLTETSLFPQAVAAAGLHHGILYRDLVIAAMGRSGPAQGPSTRPVVTVSPG